MSFFIIGKVWVFPAVILQESAPIPTLTPPGKNIWNWTMLPSRGKCIGYPSWICCQKRADEGLLFPWNTSEQAWDMTQTLWSTLTFFENKQYLTTEVLPAGSPPPLSLVPCLHFFCLSCCSSGYLLCCTYPPASRWLQHPPTAFSSVLWIITFPLLMSSFPE